jgi:hypothetical protein
MSRFRPQVCFERAKLLDGTISLGANTDFTCPARVKPASTNDRRQTILPVLGTLIERISSINDFGWYSAL